MRRKNNAEGQGNRPALRWLLTMGLLVLWSLAVGLVALYYAGRTSGYALFFSYLHSARLLLLNLLPGVLLALLLFALTNRLWPAVLVSGVLIIGASLGNFFKLQTRSEPLLAADLRYLGEAANISSRYTIVITPTMILCGVAVAAATVLSCLFLKTRFKKWWPRLLLLLAVLGTGTWAYLGLYRSEDVYTRTENLDVVLADGSTLNQWNETDQFSCRGFWYPFLYSTKELGASRPENYSADEAEALLAAYPSEDLPAEKKVNFLSIMLEAYADFSVYDQLEFTENDPYAFFHTLQQESISGSLDVNIFAGGTIDTERCYMTGSTEMYDYRAAADSFVRWFRSQGYTTEFSHPGYDWFYNRKNVAEYLGFDRSFFGESDYAISEDGATLMDAEFFPRLVTQLHETTAAGTPCFSMSVTYQNHGPYASDYLYSEDTIFVRQNGLSDESYNILNNYLYGIDITDAALEALVYELRYDPEPVVLVLFGDHKPWLGDNGSVYAEAGIDLTYYYNENYYNYGQTPYVIWANDAAKAVLGTDFTGEGGDFSPCYLMMKVFDACGYTGDAYINVQRDAFDTISLLSPRLRIYRTEDGTITAWVDHLSAAAQETLTRLNTLSYYRMRDAER